ncbi:hypothetical protein QF027_009277 [Streptomyces canus]|nr:hypothetical protein [Streptomyces canus]
MTTAFPSRRSPATAPSCSGNPSTKVPTPKPQPWCTRWAGAAGWSVPMAVAAASGVMYLEAAGMPVKPAREDAVALKDLLLDPACTAGKIAALLRTWPTAT